VEGAAEDAPVAGGPDRVDNTAAFAALTAILEGGDAFAIFPEGISHTRPELAPLKSGAARIVLGAAAAGVPVQLVPCGLSYRRRDRMRSRVLVQYGRPIVVDDAFVASWNKDPVRAAKALTSTLNLALRAQTINATDFETLRVLDAVKTIYRPPGRTFTLAEEAELMRRFLDQWERKSHLPEFQTLYQDTESYLAELRALSLSDAELTGSFSWWDKAVRLLRHVFFLAVLLPVAIPGIILHTPVLIAAVMAAKTLTTRGDVRATIQMGVVTLATLVTYLVAAGIAWWSQPTALDGVVAATATLLGLVLSGAATMRVLDGEGAARRGLWTLVALFHLDRELEGLRARRDGIRRLLLDIVKNHIDEGMERLVPDSEHEDAEPWLDDEDAH
jgi:glycerol-3-phosphate O-acyltransferase/dihydroxyacetone phosphate acyltransferase